MARPKCVKRPLLFYNACVGFPNLTLLVVVGVWELAESVVLWCSRKGGQFSPTTLVLGCKGTGHYSASFAWYVGDITNWCFQGCWCTNACWSYGGAHWPGQEWNPWLCPKPCLLGYFDLLITSGSSFFWILNFLNFLNLEKEKKRKKKTMGSNCLRNFRIKESRPVFMHVKSLGLYLPLYVYIRFKDSSLGGEPLCWPFLPRQGYCV